MFVKLLKTIFENQFFKTHMNENKLPTLAELTQDVEVAYKNDQFNLLLNQEAPAKWVKTHPYIKNHKYLPIDKVEYLLRRIFKTYSIEITGQGTAFNGVWVTIRLKVTNPVSGELMESERLNYKLNQAQVLRSCKTLITVLWQWLFLSLKLTP